MLTMGRGLLLAETQDVEHMIDVCGFETLRHYKVRVSPYYGGNQF